MISKVVPLQGGKRGCTIFSVIATRLGNDTEIKASLSPYKAMNKYLIANSSGIRIYLFFHLAETQDKRMLLELLGNMVSSRLTSMN